MATQENYLKKELYDLVRKDDSVFEFLQSGSLDGIWYWDLEKPENEWMSPRFWKNFGYDPKKRKHKSNEWQDLINKQDLKLALQNFNAHCEDESHPYDQLVRYKKKSGSTAWVRCRGIVIRDKKGKPVRMLGAHNDVTDLKKAEAKLKKLNKKYQEKIEELERVNKAMVGRELKMIELKKEINQLLKKLGKSAKY